MPLNYVANKTVIFRKGEEQAGPSNRKELVHMSRFLDFLQSNLEWYDEEENEEDEESIPGIRIRPGINPDVPTDDSAQPNLEDVPGQEKSEPSSCSHNAQIIGFMSGKGGVGKTGISINVANFCAENGDRVLLLDCDLNTNGATVFFGLDDQKEAFHKFENVLDFQMILSDLLNEEVIGVHRDTMDAKPVSISENFFFIPAGIGGNIFDEREMTDTLFAKAEQKMEEYCAVWRKEYELIIFDFGAGWGVLNKLLIRIVDDICIVMRTDDISRYAVQMKLGFIFQMHNLRNTFCCMNMIDEDSGTVRSKAGLLNEIKGFPFSYKYASAFDKGKMIELTGSALSRRLAGIVRSIVRNPNALRNYERKQAEREEKEHMQKIRRVRNSAAIILLLVYIIAFSIVILNIGITEQVKLAYYILATICFVFIEWLVWGRGKIYDSFREFFCRYLKQDRH